MAVYTAVFALAVIALLSLILDGGVAMNAKQRAADVAGQAARAAADDINVALLRETGSAEIAPGACQQAARLVAAYARTASHGADHLTRATMTSCRLVGAETATVTVTVATSPLVPGFAGGFVETSSASATAMCGITKGKVC